MFLADHHAECDGYIDEATAISRTLLARIPSPAAASPFFPAFECGISPDWAFALGVGINHTSILDSASTPTFEAHCQQAIAQGERSVILDFRSLDYLRSAGLRSILIVAKSIGAAGGEFAPANARGMVREVFEISGFLGIFRCLGSFGTPAAQD